MIGARKALTCPLCKERQPHQPSLWSLPDRAGALLQVTVSHAFMGRFHTTAPFVQIWKYSSLLPSPQLPYGFVETGLKGSRGKKNPRNKTTNRWNWFIFGIKRWGWRPFRNIKPCAEPANRLLVWQRLYTFFQKNNMWQKIEAPLFYRTTVSNLNETQFSSLSKPTSQFASVFSFSWTKYSRTLKYVLNISLLEVYLKNFRK